MEYRQLEPSSLRVPELNFGTVTSTDKSKLFTTRWLNDVCMASGAKPFETVNLYSNRAEEILGDPARRLAVPSRGWSEGGVNEA